MSVHIPHAVPAPTITITGVPPYPLYTGTELSLTCSIELHSMVNSEVTLSSMWRSGGQILSTNGRVNVSTTSMVRSSLYRKTLRISPLSNTMDGGQYSCQSDIASSDFVRYTNAIQQVVISIGG